MKTPAESCGYQLITAISTMAAGQPGLQHLWRSLLAYNNGNGWPLQWRKRAIGCSWRRQYLLIQYNAALGGGSNGAGQWLS